MEPLFGQGSKKRRILHSISDMGNRRPLGGRFSRRTLRDSTRFSDTLSEWAKSFSP
jgi:hypothetical protein